MDHIATAFPNMHQVQVAENFVNEEVHFTKDVYRNPGTSAQPRDTSYPNRDVYTGGQRGAGSSQYPPYRPPGYQEPQPQYNR